MATVSIEAAPAGLSWQRFAWWGVWLLALYRLAVVLWGDIPVDVEEAYYLSWTRHLDWGYFSKPPLLPAVMAVVRGVLGETPAVLKGIAIFFHSGAALFVYAIGSRLYDARTGAWAAIAFQTMPIIGILSMFVSTDAPLMFFWAAVLYGFVRASESDRLGWWLFTGLMGGLGLLSKYTIGALAVGLVLYLVVDPPARRLLGSPRLWAGLVLALAVWLPNLWWLGAHDWITIDHTRHITLEIQRAGDWGNLGQFLLGQLGAFGPLMGLVALYWLWSPSLWRQQASRLLMLTSLPLLVLVSWQAWRHEANLNWASPSYIGLVLVGTHWMLIHARRLFYAAVGLNLLLLSGLYHYHALADLLDVPLTRGTDPYSKRLGWAELGAQLAQIRRGHPQAVLLSDSRKLLALMGYHARIDGRPPVLRSWNPAGYWRHQYDLYDDIAQHGENDYLFVSERPLEETVLARFEQAELVAVLRARVYPDLVRRVYVYHLQGFQGYPR